MKGMRRFYNLGEVIGAIYPDAQWAVYDNDYEKLNWYSTNFPKPTLEQIAQKRTELEAAEPMRVVREIRDWYLEQSDWTQGADIRNLRGQEWCAAWDSYRNQLRNLPDSGIQPYFDEMNFIKGVVWPQKPNSK
jgi:hypothetical protein